MNLTSVQTAQAVARVVVETRGGVALGRAAKRRVAEMSQTEKWTIRSLLEWTTSYLKEKSADSPKLDAEALLAYALDTTRVQLFVSYDDTASDDVRAKFREYVRRRAVGEPVAYIIGKKEFYSQDFEVNSDVLVPRPETEELVLATIEYVRKQTKTFGARPSADETSASSAAFRFCDVGTGSGCIAATLASQLPNAVVVALDCSPAALEVARRNAVKLGVDAKIEFLQSDLFEKIPSDLPEEERFDVIVSNPPYVSEPEYETLDRTVHDFEPRLALVGGPTGAELPIELIKQAVDRLKSGGKIFLELSPTTVDAVADAMNADGRWTDVEIRPDFAHRPRFVVASRK